MSIAVPPSMIQALGLANQALFLSSPAPRVGCVLTDVAGDVLGCGFTQRVGEPHAEVMAWREAVKNGRCLQGSTAYITLEPCSHDGGTDPRCDVLIQAGVAQVVASIAHPNPRLAGSGFSRLRAAGIDVVIGPGAKESRELNIGFFSRMIRGTPWVRLKTAASLDGTTALQNGVSQWITAPMARADGHVWRARACAILTGIGTVLDDDPRLDIREVPTPRQPKVVIIDSQLQLPLNARLLQPDRECFVYSATIDTVKVAALEARGVTVVCMPNAVGKVDLASMLRDLGERGINELHVEAGHKLNGSLIYGGLVDELLVYLAPQLLGSGLGMANLGPLTQLKDGVALEFKSVDRIGPDLRLIARVVGRENF
ncbi:MAG: bifunctional diaminohydroxyphosphoribosylaminopyrimidine deaminase/5-amino-6-(5-phosphoribosylamino)uracil reductase RibD [Alcaligenaceae bacterium]|nr:MAG: bifunctional diaminohydroxyphosphoribosylaminopyrimidine deaminase/5-amino-6-(5-phosphoribosylamino)uracil reductase RibD [Alcaligenaceae bacterium]